MITPPLEAGLFDTISGLPVHPLVVHFAVVLLPLAALALVVIVLVPRWRGTFGWITLAGLAIGTGAAFVAKESGEALAARVGEPEQHAELGDVLPLVAALLFVVAVAWFLLDRRRRASESGGSGVIVTILGGAAALIAVGTIGLTIAVGHSGATAVWAGEIAATNGAAGQPTGDGDEAGETGEGPESGEAGASSAAPSTPTATYTLADVAAHATPGDCWTVVDGTVYDVTSWIDRHPGGAAAIEGLCGIDGTDAFRNQHGNQGEPNAELAQFAIGTLAAPAAAGRPVQVTPVALAAAPTAKRYTRAEVRRHATARDCWTIIGRNVYDLTDWVSRHPGGASRIIALCGRDGTQAFRAQHGGQGEPTTTLARYRIGRLASPASA